MSCAGSRSSKLVSVVAFIFGFKTVLKDPFPPVSGNGYCKLLTEEVSDFNSGGFDSVGTVDSVGVDRVGEVSTDGAFVGLLRIGGAHQFAVFQDGVLAFQGLDHDGTGDHEVDQVLEEAALFVSGVEAFSIFARQLLHMGGNDFQASTLDTAIDLADNVFCNGV